jgi:hypothetical protein
VTHTPVGPAPGAALSVAVEVLVILVSRIAAASMAPVALAQRRAGDDDVACGSPPVTVSLVNGRRFDMDWSDFVPFTMRSLAVNHNDF